MQVAENGGGRPTPLEMAGCGLILAIMLLALLVAFIGLFTGGHTFYNLIFA